MPDPHDKLNLSGFTSSCCVSQELAKHLVSETAGLNFCQGCLFLIFFFGIDLNLEKTEKKQ